MMKAALNGVYLLISPYINLYLTDTPGESLAFKTSNGNLNQDWFIYPFQGASVIQNVHTQKFVNCDLFKTQNELYLHRTDDSHLDKVVDTADHRNEAFTILEIRIAERKLSSTLMLTTHSSDRCLR